MKPPAFKEYYVHHSPRFSSRADQGYWAQDGSMSNTVTNERIPRRLVELICTGVCLASILLSLLAEKGGAPAIAVLALDILAYASGGYFGLLASLAALRARTLNVDFLMILAAVGAAVIDQWHEGATLLFLFSLSNTLQDYAMERSRRAIDGLLKLRPTEASVLREGVEQRIPVEELAIGDRVVVRPGEMLPSDGVIRQGNSDLNEASITGESKPADKGPGDKVFGGTLNGAGSLEFEVTVNPEDSTLARIVDLVESAQAQKSRTQRFLDDVEGYYAWTIVGGAMLLILIPWLALGQEFSPVFYRAMVFLVVASPCALVISTPASVLSAIAAGARQGVLFKGGLHLENLAEVTVAAFDKTGTLTTGKLSLTDVVSGSSGFSEDQVLAYAAALESRSEHPIAKAILRGAAERGITPLPVRDFVNMPGRGAHGIVENFLVWIGGERMYQEHGESIAPALAAEKRRLEAEGKTVLVLHRELGRKNGVGEHENEGGWLGAVAVSDTVRRGLPEIMARLRRGGITHTAMLTGDNATVAANVASQAGVDAYYADLLPEEKVSLLHRLARDHGPVMMIGDGVNDAPALAHATVGVAMGAAGTDVALESADVVLMGDDLDKIPFALHLSRRTVRIVRYNVAFALAVVAFLVAAVFLFDLPLPLGVLGHEGSTIIVVANGLRLLTTSPDP